ncbi:MAG: imidazole glycerol phosphate synthase subunit HisH [Gammaproteobacteria bacterium]
MINIFKCNASNIASVQSSLKRLGLSEKDLDRTNRRSKFFLPGVSSFDSYVLSLNENNVRPTLINNKNIDIIGICAGAQILFESSQEGNERGLGLFPGRVKKIATSSNIKVPHLGWNTIVLNENHPMVHLFDGIDLANKKFYFSHSYRFPDSEHALAYVDYGERFPVVVAKDNLIAIQFHPEKSYGQGLQLLKNICEL